MSLLLRFLIMCSQNKVLYILRIRIVPEPNIDIKGIGNYSTIKL